MSVCEFLHTPLPATTPTHIPHTMLKDKEYLELEVQGSMKGLSLSERSIAKTDVNRAGQVRIARWPGEGIKRNPMM